MEVEQNKRSPTVADGAEGRPGMVEQAAGRPVEANRSTRRPVVVEHPMTRIRRWNDRLLELLGGPMVQWLCPVLQRLKLLEGRAMELLRPMTSLRGAREVNEPSSQG